MCRRVAEGTQYQGCGHFKRELVIAIVDCELRHCAKSVKHPANREDCRSCARRNCIDHWGPDLQKVLRVSTAVCSGCMFQPPPHAVQHHPPPPPPSWGPPPAFYY